MIELESRIQEQIRQLCEIKDYIRGIDYQLSQTAHLLAWREALTIAAAAQCEALTFGVLR